VFLQPSGEVPGAFREAIVEPKEGCAPGERFLLQPSGIQDLDLHHVIIEGQIDEEDGCVSVSAHDHTELNQRVVLAIAEAIEMVPPF